MPPDDPYPSIYPVAEAGFSLSSQHEYDHWAEPKIIVDPVGCTVVAILPPGHQPRRAGPAGGRIAEKRSGEKQLLRRSVLRRWLEVALGSALFFAETTIPARAD